MIYNHTCSSLRRGLPTQATVPRKLLSTCPKLWVKLILPKFQHFKGMRNVCFAWVKSDTEKEERECQAGHFWVCRIGAVGWTKDKVKVTLDLGPWRAIIANHKLFQLSQYFQNDHDLPIEGGLLWRNRSLSPWSSPKRARCILLMLSWPANPAAY